MKRIFRIALIDLKIMVKDKIFFFWTLIFPLVFIFIFGNVYQGNSTKVKAQLIIVNKDTGKWGNYFTKKIKSPDIEIINLKKTPVKFNRYLIIPSDFSDKISTGTPQDLIFVKKNNANSMASAQIEAKLFQAIIKVSSELIMNSGAKDFFKNNLNYKEIIEIKMNYAENSLKIPTGYDHVIPGILVQFILMMVLIYGGIVVMTNRQKGILVRILYSSTSIFELWTGNFLGRLFMGLLQAFILITIGISFFNLNLGNNFLAFLIILFFSMSIASLSILFGSVLKKEELIVGISILTANMFAALGGCWWPIEIVPQTFKTIGMLSPSYWAMDAFHKIIFFNKNLSDISLNLLVLLGYTIIFSIISIRYFKIKD